MINLASSILQVRQSLHVKWSFPINLSFFLGKLAHSLFNCHLWTNEIEVNPSFYKAWEGVRPDSRLTLYFCCYSSEMECCIKAPANTDYSQTNKVRSALHVYVLKNIWTSKTNSQVHRLPEKHAYISFNQFSMYIWVYFCTVLLHT